MFIFAPSLLQKQINVHNKVVKHVMDLVNTAREEWETETASRTSQPQTCSNSETEVLLAALGTGKGIKMMPGRAPPPGPSPTISQPPPQSEFPFLFVERSWTLHILLLCILE